MNQNLKELKQKATRVIDKRRRVANFLNSPRKVETALQAARYDILAKLTPADRELLVRLGINKHIVPNNLELNLWGDLTCDWYGTHPDEDFTDSPSATIGSDLKVGLTVYHTHRFEGISIATVINLYHDLSPEDEVLLRSINVIRTEYEPQRSSTVVSCELPNA